MYTYWSTKVSSVHEVIGQYVQMSKFQSDTPGRKERGSQSMGKRNGKKERYYQMPKREHGAEICKLGVKGERPYICTFMWFLLSIRALH